MQKCVYGEATGVPATNVESENCMNVEELACSFDNRRFQDEKDLTGTTH